MYASVGAVATLSEPATWNQALLGVTPHRGKANSRFISFWLQHAAKEAMADVRSSTQNNLNADQVANFPFPDLSVEDQRRIADFLDDQVARIDNIISARRQQIRGLSSLFDRRWTELAQELERNAPVVPIRRVLTSITDGPFGSSLTSSHYADSGVRVIRLGNLGIDEFKASDEAYISNDYGRELSGHSVSAGDLLMAGLGDKKWPLGRCCVAPVGLGGAIVKADCYRLRLDERVDHSFASWYLSSPPARDRFQIISRGATRARLNTGLAREALIPLVSRNEQASIVAEAAESRNRCRATEDGLIASIALLTEYKQSLITAAVTGELDVTTPSNRIPA